MHVAYTGLWTQSSTACWSPGMQGSARSALAESLVLRGPRRGGAALPSQQAADLLDRSLLLEGGPCTQSLVQTSASNPCASFDCLVPHSMRLCPPLLWSTLLTLHNMHSSAPSPSPALVEPAHPPPFCQAFGRFLSLTCTNTVVPEHPTAYDNMQVLQ